MQLEPSWQLDDMVFSNNGNNRRTNAASDENAGTDRNRHLKGRMWILIE